MRYYFIDHHYYGLHTGLGGHYYSLMNIARGIGDNYRIIVFGKKMPEVYTGDNKVICKNIPFYASSRILDDYVRLHGTPQVLHAYGDAPAAFASWLSAKYNVPLIVTKPGGPPLRKTYIPYNNMIVFHHADYKNIKTKYFAPQNLKIIPARVPDLQNMIVDRENPFDKMPPADVRIICIARLRSTYWGRFSQAINLVKELNNYGISSNLVIIGSTQEKRVLDQLKSKTKDSINIQILTSHKFTQRAFELLRYADVVVGEGRSFIEGLCFAKYMFVPVRRSSLPCFVDSFNYLDAAKENFSQRTIKSERIDPEQCLRKFIEVRRTRGKEYKRWARQKFLEHHALEKGVSDTIRFYSICNNKESYIGSIFRRIELTVKLGLNMIRSKNTFRGKKA